MIQPKPSCIQDLILYHGTRAVFNEFELSSNPLVAGTLRGFYFTSDREAALEYGSNIITVSLKIDSLFTGDPFAHYAQHIGVDKPGFGSSREAFQAYKAVTPAAVKTHLLAEGYDGILIPAHTKYADHDEWIVFNKEQISILDMVKQPKSNMRREIVTGSSFQP